VLGTTGPKDECMYYMTDVAILVGQAATSHKLFAIVGFLCLH
jgi:hypothetical protein